MPSGSYLRRLLLYFILGSVLPVVLLGIAVLHFTNTSLQEDLIDRSERAGAIISQDIDSLTDSYVTILNSLSQDETVQRLLAGDPDISSQEGFSRLYLVASGHASGAQFQILSLDGAVRLSTGVIGSSYLLPNMAEWGILGQASRQAAVTLSAADKSKDENRNIAFSLARSVTYNGHLVGFVAVDIARAAVIEIMHDRAAATSFNCLLTDQYHYVCVNQQYTAQEGFRGFPSDYRKEIQGGSGYFYHTGADKERWLITYHQSPETGLTVVQQVSTNVVNSSIELLRQIFFGLLIILAILLPMFIYSLAENLWRPIQSLTIAMRKVWQEDLNTRVYLNRRDEIGELGNNFNEMVSHMQALIRNVEDKQRLLRIAQVEALQAQIKPHFIYNTLDMIKWQAKGGNTDEVASLAVQLGKLLRMTISKNSEYVMVADEVKVLEYYLFIQQKRFADRLQVSFQVEDAILPCRIPRLILQPIVENAMVHGLEPSRKPGVLTITGNRDGDYLRFVIEDNGVGMSEEKAVWLLEESDSQIGVRNVDLRARLHGDKHCGLYIDSREGVGTRIVLIIKEIEGGEVSRDEEGNRDR